jgi:hypothetical protein
MRVLPRVCALFLVLSAVPASAQPQADAAALLAAGDLALRRGGAIESLVSLRAAAVAAEAAGDAALLGRIHTSLSEAHGRLGDWAAFLDFATRAFEAAPAPDIRQRITYLNARGRALMEMRERDAALREYGRRCRSPARSRTSG